MDDKRKKSVAEKLEQMNQRPVPYEGLTPTQRAEKKPLSEADRARRAEHAAHLLEAD